MLSIKDNFCPLKTERDNIESNLLIISKNVTTMPNEKLDLENAMISILSIGFHVKLAKLSTVSRKASFISEVSVFSLMRICVGWGIRGDTVALLDLTPWLTGAGARSAQGTNTGHKNAEGMASVGVRVEPPVRHFCNVMEPVYWVGKIFLFWL